MQGGLHSHRGRVLVGSNGQWEVQGERQRGQVQVLLEALTCRLHNELQPADAPSSNVVSLIRLAVLQLEGAYAANVEGGGGPSLASRPAGRVCRSPGGLA